MIFGEPQLKIVRELGLDYPYNIIGKYCPDPGLGISWLWMLPDTHPLHWAAVIHDFEYVVKAFKSSYIPDKRFLRNALKLAGNNGLYVAQAYTFYWLAVAWGRVKWKQKDSKGFFSSLKISYK